MKTDASVAAEVAFSIMIRVPSVRVGVSTADQGLIRLRGESDCVIETKQ